MRIIFSASEDGLALAVRELHRELGPDVRVETVGPDVGVIVDPGISVAALAERCLATPLVFVTHLTTQVARLDSATLDHLAAAAVKACTGRAKVAVHAWVSGTNTFGFGSAAAFAAIAEALGANGIEVARARQPWVLSVCVTPSAVLLGLNKTADSLSDWPGGRVRLARSADQVSRAEFKLEEALLTFPIKLPARGTAVDFGAAPGGWTRILRAHGLKVIAVDPADLDPRLDNDRGLRHLRTTAGEFLRSKPQHYDLVVNDVRMDAVMSSELMVAAAARLSPGGGGVLTLKIGTHRVLETVDRCLVVLRQAYQVVGARQLQHNRHEVTVVLRRR